MGSLDNFCPVCSPSRLLQFQPLRRPDTVVEIPSNLLRGPPEVLASLRRRGGSSGAVPHEDSGLAGFGSPVLSLVCGCTSGLSALVGRSTICSCAILIWSSLEEESRRRSSSLHSPRSKHCGKPNPRRSAWTRDVWDPGAPFQQLLLKQAKLTTSNPKRSGGSAR